MSRLSGEFETDLALPDTLEACAEAFHQLGWTIDSVKAERIVSRAGLASEDPPTVEVELSEGDGGTTMRVTGSDTESNRLEQDELVAVLDKARDAIEASIDRTSKQGETAEQTRAAEPTGDGDGDGDGAHDEKADGEPKDAGEKDDSTADTAATGAAATTAAAAGWYPDVHNEGHEQYWDGEQWTDQRRPADASGEGDASEEPESTDEQVTSEDRAPRETETAPPASESYAPETSESQTPAPAADRTAPEAQADTQDPGSRFRSLHAIAGIYGVLGWIVAIVGPIVVIVAAVSASGGNRAAVLIGGLIGVALNALLFFGIAAAIRLALAVEENTRTTVELLRRQLEGR